MNNYIDLPVEGGSGGVSSLNTLVGALTLVAGPGIVIGASGTNITISSPGSGVVFPLVAPSGSAAAPSYAFSETGDDTGFYSQGDGDISFSNNGSLGMELDSSHNLNVIGTITASNFPVTGSANTFAGFSNAGALESLPGWNYIPAYNGISTGGSGDPSTIGSYTAANFDADFSPTSDTTNSFTHMNFQSEYDNAGLGFSATGEWDELLLSQHHNGSGSVAAVRSMLVSQNIGDGTKAASTTNLILGTFVSNVNANASIQDSNSFFIQLNNNGTVTEDARLLDLNINGNDIGRHIQGITVNLQSNAVGDQRLLSLGSSGTTGGNFTQLDGNNGGNVVGQYVAIGLDNSGNVGQQYQGMRIGNNGSVGQSYTGVQIFNQGQITQQYTGVYAQNNGNVLGSLNGISFGNQGDITDHINLINLFTSGTYAGGITGINLSMQGTSSDNSNPVGLNIDMNNIVSSQQLVGLSINNGALNVQSNYDTSILTPSGEFQQNDLGGQLHIAAGHPISGAFGFGNNLGITVAAEDDMVADNFLGSESLGFSVNGFVNQIAVSSGKTIHTLQYMLAGGSFPSVSTGGTITNVAGFRSIGIINGGGSLNITNEIQFHADAAVDLGSPTNLWGFRSDSTNANNWFAKNVVIGGTTMFPSGNNALDVTGVGQIANSVTDSGTSALVVNATSHTTVDGSNTTIGINGVATGTVDVGATNDKALLGMNFVVTRGNATDAGTLDTLSGANVLMFVNSDTAGVTNKAYGFSNTTFSENGTLTNLYDFYSLRVPAGPGVVTNHYGVYIEADTTTPVLNWMSGSTRIGGTSFSAPSKSLEVVGDMSATGDIASATLTPGNGATGTFTTVDLKTVTVTNGIITSIV